MEILTIISAAIRGIGLIANNPLLGGGSSVKFQEAAELLNILGGLVEAGSEAHDELKAFAATISEMAEQGRGPTRAEWDNLRARSLAAHETIQEAAAAIRGEEEEEEEEEEVELSEFTKAELLELAEEEGIAVSSSMTKAQIIAAIEEG